MKVFAVVIISVVALAATGAYPMPFGRFGGFPMGFMGRFPGFLHPRFGFGFPGGMSMGYGNPYANGYAQGPVPDYRAAGGAMSPDPTININVDVVQ